MRVYIHIPFCESKCKYCKFASIWSLNSLLIDKYVNHLCQDIKTKKRPVLKETGLKLSSIYFWGWTPWVLDENHLFSIFKSIKESFELDENIEITLETTPENITSEKISIWEKFWINRLSFWIQTLNNKTLKEIKRQGSETIFAGLDLLQSSKIKNISVDFIVWLPYVKKGELLLDIKNILLKYNFINHISLYMLEDYYDTSEEDKMYDKITYPNNWNDICMSDEDIVWDYLEISKYLQDIWYNRYELSNFAKHWYECQHNMWYWNHDEVIAFWLGSHWFLDNTRYAFSWDFLKFYAWEYDYIEKLNKKDIFLEKLMFWLRTIWLDEDVYSDLDITKINNLVDLWYLRFEKNKLVLTQKWIWVMDFIIWELY